MLKPKNPNLPISELMPPMAEIPEQFKKHKLKNKWNKLFTDWFYFGIEGCEWIPKEGINTDEAYAHIASIMGHIDCRHEHKEAGVAYLLSEFFEDVKYRRKVG